MPDMNYELKGIDKRVALLFANSIHHYPNNDNSLPHDLVGPLLAALRLLPF